MHSLPFGCKELTNVHQPEAFLWAKMCLKYPARVFGLGSFRLLLLPFFLSSPNSSPLHHGGFPFHSWLLGHIFLSGHVLFSTLTSPSLASRSALTAVSLILQFLHWEDSSPDPSWLNITQSKGQRA